MIQIRLRRVKLRAFRSFLDEHDTGELPDRGLVLIRGKNLDTGSSSGAGKTSILLAIQYALGICHYPATKLQSLHTKRKLQVELHLDTPRGRAILKRGEVTSLQVGEEPMVEGATAVDDHLRQLLALDKDLLEALTYRRQKSPGRFLSMTDADKKEFLSKLLGLEKLEQSVGEVSKSLPALQATVERAKVVEQGIRNELANLPVIIDQPADEGPAKHACAVTRSELSRAEKEFDEACKRLQEVEDAAKSEKSTLVRTVTEGKARLRKRGEDAKKAWDETHPAPAPAADTADLENTLVECRQRLERAKVAWKIAQDEAAEPVRRLADELRIAEQAGAEAHELKLKGEELQEKIEYLSVKAKCPTCKQDWQTADATKHLTALRAEFDRIQRLRDEKVALHGQSVVLSAKLKDAQAHLEEVRSKNPVVEALQRVEQGLVAKLAAINATAAQVLQTYQVDRKAAYAEIDREIMAEETKLDADYNAALFALMEKIKPFEAARNDAQAKHARAKLAEQEARSELARLQADNVRILQRHEDRDRQAANIQVRLEKAVQAVRDAETELAIEADTVDLLKAFLGAIMGEILEEIAQETNDYLRELPNVQNTTLAFRTETLTKKGTTHQRIQCVVEKGGVEYPLDAGLSGGQATSVELAVDLAVGQVIGRRMGNVPGYLILDESFEGHDLPVKEACMGILAKAAEDRLILVVDHAQEFQSAFTSFIDVESSNDTSRIV